MITREEVTNFLCDRPAINVTQFAKECGVSKPYFYLETKIQSVKATKIMVVMRRYGYREY